jgi:hypothetical protein
LGVSRQGEFKNTMSKTFPKISTKKSMSVFSRFFSVLSRFRVFFSDGSSKTLKKIVSKSFYKKFDQKSKTDFFSVFVFSRFWAFLDEGSSKTRYKNIEKINLTLVLFRTLTHPPTTGVTDFFFWRPLGPLVDEVVLGTIPREFRYWGRWEPARRLQKKKKQARKQKYGEKRPTDFPFFLFF